MYAVTKVFTSISRQLLVYELSDLKPRLCYLIDFKQKEK